MKIQNFETLATTGARRSALLIAEAGLEAIDTVHAVHACMRLEGDTLHVKEGAYDIKNRRIFVVGVGKCALDAGGAAESILGDRITAGIVLDVRPGNLRKIRVYAGTHPFPSEQNVDATKEIIKLLTGLSDADLVIFFISGGGSTLLCQPTNFTCVEEKLLIECLFRGGATIAELNTIRKHHSLARGGYLAKYAYPAQVISLIFSDVPGDNLEFIASGPTVKDTTTVADAEKILMKYDTAGQCGTTAKELIETPKESRYFEAVQNILIVSNRIALDAMAKTAEELGYATRVVMANLMGEAREVAQTLLWDLGKAGPKTALLYGGETTVTVKNKDAKGGRNLELALAGLKFAKDGDLLLSVASDGHDNTEFAGAFCDKINKERAREMNIDPDAYLERNASYEFFSKVGGCLLTGSTGSNVSDLIITLKE